MEMLHRRYHNIELLMQMEFEEFCEFITRAKEKEQREELHAQWVTMLPLMSTGQLKYVSFESYIDQCTGKNLDLRPASEIIEELERIHGEKLI